MTEYDINKIEKKLRNARYFQGILSVVTVLVLLFYFYEKTNTEYTINILNLNKQSLENDLQFKESLLRDCLNIKTAYKPKYNTHNEDEQFINQDS